MELRYGFINDERCKEIDSWKIKDPYGYGEIYTAEREYFVTNEDETILFCHAFSARHDDISENTFLYNDSYIFIEHHNYGFIHFDRKVNTVGEYRYINICIPKEQSIEQHADKIKLLMILKEMITMYELNWKFFKIDKKFVVTFQYDEEEI